ncbi:hypothetical protein SAMN04490187_5832 [Pseudomonas jessenii]|jgi:hypothetical protein|uniref:Uncharacterized protein n=2 Tax=Pseudomonas TaxID=286 RepID=A0A1H4VK54_PSEJE|nr:hypothetical protein SAMN04490187_5832 [Pseudomonas jessenii]VVP98741.1 hypothetical protein PS922_03438 [Pseudomonas fluorescens]
MLAMDVNDNARCLNDRVARTFFASKLAPTGLSESPGFRGFQRRIEFLL